MEYPVISVWNGTKNGFIKALLAEIFTAHVPHPRTNIWAQESIPNLAESIPGFLKRLQIRALVSL
jgi:hypothetical protein